VICEFCYKQTMWQMEWCIGCSSCVGILCLPYFYTKSKKPKKLYKSKNFLKNLGFFQPWLLTMVLTPDCSWSLYIGPTLWPTKYWKNTTAGLQHKPYTGWNKTVRKLVNKYLLMVTFENGKNYSKFQIMAQYSIDSIWKTICTALLLLSCYV